MRPCRKPVPTVGVNDGARSPLILSARDASHRRVSGSSPSPVSAHQASVPPTPVNIARAKNCHVQSARVR